MSHSFHVVNKKTFLLSLAAVGGLIVGSTYLVLQKQDKFLNEFSHQSKQLNLLINQVSEVRNSVTENRIALKEITSFNNLATKAGNTNSSWFSCKDQVKLQEWALDSFIRLESIKLNYPKKRGSKK